MPNYRTLTLTPAYGRDYKSKRALMDDWGTDKDFVVNDYKQSGTYVNKQQLSDLRAEGITHLQFRYQKLTKLHILPLLGMY